MTYEEQLKSTCADFCTGDSCILVAKEMMIMTKTIVILSLLLCVLISGCAKNVRTPESDIAVEESAEAQQQVESNQSPANIMPSAIPSPVSDETESTMTAAPTPFAQTSPAVVQTPAPSPVSIQTPVPTQSQAVTQTPIPSFASTPETITHTYSVWAESGAVITSFDSTTGKFQYKRKCETCGETENGSTLAFVGSGSGLTSSFTCSKCGSHQKLVIGWSCTKN